MVHHSKVVATLIRCAQRGMCGRRIVAGFLLEEDVGRLLHHNLLGAVVGGMPSYVKGKDLVLNSF